MLSFLDKNIHLPVVGDFKYKPRSVVMGSPISVVDELQRNHGGKLWLAIEEMEEGSQFIT